MNDKFTPEQHQAERSKTLAFFEKNSQALPGTGQRGAKASDNFKTLANSEEPTAQYVEAVRRQLPNLAYNVGIVLRGGYVDIDDDSRSPFVSEALDRFLPRSKHIWGRPGAPRSHRLYRLMAVPSDDPEGKLTPVRLLREGMRRQLIPLKNAFLSDHQKGGVEFRRADPISTDWSVLPGSAHHSGELVTWASDALPSESVVACNPEQLFSAYRQAIACAMIAPFWVPGVRNSMCMALSGFLHRLSQIALETASEGEVPFLLDKTEAMAFLENLMDIADEDPSDYVMRRRTFENTWNKAEEESIPVTGGKTLAELADCPELLSKLYTVLSDSRSAQQVAEFMERFALWVGRGHYVDLRYPENVMTKEQFLESHSNVFVPDAKGVPRPLAARLKSMQQTIRVSGLTFDPSTTEALVSDVNEPSEHRKVNTFRGFAVAPATGVTKEDVAPFREYVWNVLASQNRDAYEWIMDYCANIFQAPHQRYGTCLVLTGKPGTGKTFLHEKVLGPIIGSQYYVQNDTIEHIVKQFNSLYGNRLLIGCDEATSTRRRADAEKMKALISDSKMRVEPKGKDAYSLPNHARLILTSNHSAEAVYLPDGKNDRRYTIIGISDCRRNDHEYYANLFNWLQEGGLALVHGFLASMPCTGVARLPLHNETRSTTSHVSMAAFDRWLVAICERGHPLSEASYLDFWDAATEKDAKIMRGEGINLQDWPAYVRMDAAADDLQYFMRTNTDERMGKADASLVQTKLMERSLRVVDDEGKSLAYRPHVGGGQVSNRARERLVRISPRLYAFPTWEQIAEYLNEAFGLELTKPTFDPEVEQDDKVVPLRKGTIDDDLEY